MNDEKSGPQWPLPPDEDARLAELRAFEMLDTPAEQPFDGIAEIAAALVEAPFAVLGFVDEKRHWFKAKFGTTLEGTCRSIAFCRYTILSAKTMVVEDLALDPRFADHPLVVNPPYARFYAGAPLVTFEGRCVGTLCVLDVQPRILTQEQTRLLERLASHAVDALETRRLVRVLGEGRPAPATSEGESPQEVASGSLSPDTEPQKRTPNSIP